MEEEIYQIMTDYAAGILDYDTAVLKLEHDGKLFELFGEYGGYRVAVEMLNTVM